MILIFHALISVHLHFSRISFQYIEISSRSRRESKAVRLFGPGNFMQNRNLMQDENPIREDVWLMAAVFRLVCRKQPIISNLLQIRNMLLFNSNMEMVWIIPALFRLIWRNEFIIANSPKIRNIPMPNARSQFPGETAMARRWI
jgi:hypothetical protein